MGRQGKASLRKSEDTEPSPHSSTGLATDKTAGLPRMHPKVQVSQGLGAGLKRTSQNLRLMQCLRT